MEARVIDPSRCFECGAPKECDHHVVPRVRGGTATVPMCGPCHARAHDTNRNMSTGRLTSEGLKKRLALGYPVGRQASNNPYGWKRVGRSPEFELDEKDRARVEELWRWRCEGLSLAKIAERARKPENLWVRDGRRWYPSSISAALLARSLGYPKRYMRTSRSKTSEKPSPEVATGCTEVQATPDAPPEGRPS